jgi:hypothetical protein
MDEAFCDRAIAPMAVMILMISGDAATAAANGSQYSSS